MNKSGEARFRTDDLIPRMVSEFGYRPVVAERIARKLVNDDSLVKQAFWGWWRTGMLDETFAIAGFSMEQLLARYKGNPIAAFSTLASLASDPDATAASLRRGFDTIGPRRTSSLHSEMP